MITLVTGWIATALSRRRSRKSPSAKPTTTGEGHVPVDAVSGWLEPTAHARQWTVRYVLIAYVAVWLLLGTLYVGTLVTGVHIPRGVGLLVVDSIFLTTLIPLYRAGTLRPVDVGLRRVPGARSVGLVVLSLLVYGWGSGLWGALVHVRLRRELHLGVAHQGTLIVVLTGLAMAAVVPVVEEVFFRGVLYRALRNRLAIAPASLISSVLFAIGHTQYPVLVWPAVALFGVIACLLYEHTGSLLPGIAMHSFIDAGGFERALSGDTLVVTCVFLALALILLARSAVLSLRSGRGGQQPPSPRAPRGPRRKRKTRAVDAEGV